VPIHPKTQLPSLISQPLHTQNTPKTHILQIPLQAQGTHRMPSPRSPHSHHSQRRNAACTPSALEGRTQIQTSPGPEIQTPGTSVPRPFPAPARPHGPQLPTLTQPSPTQTQHGTKPLINRPRSCSVFTHPRFSLPHHQSPFPPNLPRA
jgi:hypothetical protein